MIQLQNRKIINSQADQRTGDHCPGCPLPEKPDILENGGLKRKQNRKDEKRRLPIQN